MAVFYLDSSAAYKRIQVEQHSAALVARLDELVKNGERLVSSAITWIELARALRRFAAAGNLMPDQAVDQAVSDCTSGLSRISITSQVINTAKWIGPPLIRSLDAIHLASALLSGGSTLLTYDLRLAQAAQSISLTAETPS
ncbi:MAG: type II toxin-antitoxin system VapC family toxin [Micrococcales bacterium]|nr:type II toxin-antitoxin system VapC family toxin [Micrococcales bacterium]